MNHPVPNSDSSPKFEFLYLLEDLLLALQLFQLVDLQRLPLLLLLLQLLNLLQPLVELPQRLLVVRRRPRRRRRRGGRLRLRLGLLPSTAASRGLRLGLLPLLVLLRSLGKRFFIRGGLSVLSRLVLGELERGAGLHLVPHRRRYVGDLGCLRMLGLDALDLGVGDVEVGAVLLVAPGHFPQLVL